VIVGLVAWTAVRALGTRSPGLDAAKVYSRPIVTKVEPFQAFYPADSYHQDFLRHNPDNPYIVYNDLPKLENLKRYFPGLYQP